MNKVNLTPLKNEMSNEELQEYKLGQTVEVPDGEGMIAAFVEETFEFPVGQSEGQIEEVEEEESPDMEEIEASPDDPMYIVALLDGGSVAVSGDEIEPINELPGEGKEITDPEEVETEANEVEMSAVYEYVEGDPHTREALEDAKRRYIHENYASELGAYVEEHDATLATLEEMPVEELVNIRGVDDPHVGLDSLPDGWTRKSVLQAWVSLGGTWRTAYAHFLRAFPPNRAKRMASAYKDEVLRTEMWRGKF